MRLKSTLNLKVCRGRLLLCLFFFAEKGGCMRWNKDRDYRVSQ